MKLTRRALAVAAVTAGLLAAGATAASAAATASDPGAGAGKSGGHHTLADVQHRVDQRLDKLSARAATARQRVDANQRLTAEEKAKLDAELTKLVADVATARHQVDSATDRAGLKAARPALKTVGADRKQLSDDRKAIRNAHKKPASGS
jgi:Spy/CpxP family protein refolding chaperone